VKKVDGLNILIGETVRELRVSKNLTQEELAEKCDTSAVYISEIERGIKNPSVNTLMVISSALDIKLSNLIIDLESNLNL
jgi:transcriptional regulator with XRE-family HTH domain